MVQQGTFEFLRQLKENNNRDWFLSQKKVYETAKEDFIQLVEEVIKELAKFDPTVKDLEAKKCLFRINRDVRFSKDKSPYKINFSAVFGKEGKNTDGACYYLHLQPGGCFVAGGYWMPSPNHLKAIRQEIDYNAEVFNKIVVSKDFVATYGKLSEEEKLKTAPKEYSKDHPQIEFLKLKSFTVSHQMQDKQFFTATIAKEIAAAFQVLMPLKLFIEEAVAVS